MPCSRSAFYLGIVVAVVALGARPRHLVASPIRTPRAAPRAHHVRRGRREARASDIGRHHRRRHRGRLELSSWADLAPAPLPAVRPLAGAAEFPADTPHASHGRLSVTEVDLYGGPSLANGGDGGGIGATAQVQNNVTWDGGLSSQISGSVTAGLYGIGGEGSTQMILNATPELDLGYWNPHAMVSGVGAHLMLSYFGGALNVAGTTGALYSYTPELLFGLHGRDASRASPWSFSFGVGASIGYATGSQAKLDPTTGDEQHVVIDPYVNFTGSTDQRIGHTYLRLGISGSDRVDDIGAQGKRNLLNGSGYAWLKVFGRYYTGPQFTLTDPQWRPDLAHRRYIRASAVFTGSLYFGGAL